MARERQIKGCVLNLSASNPGNTLLGPVDKGNYQQSGITYEGGMGVASGEFVFDGSDDYISFPELVVDDFTFFARVRYASGSQGRRIASSTDITTQIMVSSSDLLQIWDGGMNEFPVAVGSASGWKSIAITYDGSNYSGYADGVLLGTIAASGRSNSFDRIGSRGDGTSWSWFDGEMDDIRIFSRRLSASEIELLHNKGVTDFVPFGNLGGEVLSIQPQRYSGSGDVLDESGNGNNGTGATIASESLNTAMNVASSGSINFDASQDFAISFWVKTDTVNTDEVIEKQSGGVFYQIRGPESSGSMRFQIDDDVLQSQVSSSTGLHDNQWHHVVAYRDAGSEIGFYIDGAASNTASDGTGGLSNSGTLIINKNNRRSLKDIRFFRRLLSPQEIKYLYNGGTPGVETPNTYGAIGYWSPSFDDAGNGSDELIDYSGAANHGTLINSPTWTSDTNRGGDRSLEYSAASSTYANLGDVDVSGNCISISMWFRADGSGGAGYHGLIGKYSTPGQPDWFIRLRASNSYGVDSNTGQVRLMRDYASQNDSSWHHLLLTFDGAQARAFVDNTELIESPQSAITSLLHTANDVLLGVGYIASSGRHLNGALDDVLIYDRVITSAERAELSASRNHFATQPTSLLVESRRRRQLAGGVL